MSHGLIFAKRGFCSPGSTFLRGVEQLGATDAWDFVNDSYLRAGRVTASGLSVTRASSGYAQREDGIWVSFASGVLRRTDKGALIENARTNLALHSRDLTQAAWTATNVTVARNQVGIDGTANSACSLTATAGNGTVLQAVIDASKARYFSVWIKRITGTGTVEVTLDNGSTWTGVTVTSAYTRVGATQTLADPTVGVRLVTSGDAVAVDFAQLEDGSFPSSPIATEGTSVTRAADVITATPTAGTNYPLSLFTEYQLLTDPGGSFVQTFVHVDDGSTNNRMLLRVNASGVLELSVIASGSPQAAITSGATIQLNVITKAAGRLDTNSAQIALNGVLSTEDTSVTLPAQPTTIRIGTVPTSVNQPWNYIRRVAVIPRALNDAELQGITT